jgi:hypothetical protein
MHRENNVKTLSFVWRFWNKNVIFNEVRADFMTRTALLGELFTLEETGGDCRYPCVVYRNIYIYIYIFLETDCVSENIQGLTWELNVHKKKV